ncbi:hypothetical protein Hanom_Chr12g01095321 [Helianthus anomalus]
MDNQIDVCNFSSLSKYVLLLVLNNDAVDFDEDNDQHVFEVESDEEAGCDGANGLGMELYVSI